MGMGYRIDLLVNKKIIIEVKTTKDIEDVYLAQLLTCLRLMDLRLGLILNFKAELMKYGIKRVIND